MPWYFDYFLHSCRYNPTIDFFIVTDDTAYSKSVPQNVNIIHATLNEINAKATQMLGFTSNITRGYKLCDFKPTYGILFSNILKGYDYWGHGDIDVIFGDIRSFITTELLTTYDLISVRHDFLTGQFLLFRNTEKINNLFTLSKDYKKILSDEKHYCFDETNFQWQSFTDGKPYQEIKSEIESMTHLVKKLETEKYLSVYYDFIIIEGLPGKLTWDCGRLFYRNKYEILLYHLVLFKNIFIPKKDIKNIPNKFSITPSRILHAA